METLFEMKSGRAAAFIDGKDIYLMPGREYYGFIDNDGSVYALRGKHLGELKD